MAARHCLALAGMAIALSACRSEPDSPPSAIAPASPATHVGAAACIACHVEEGERWRGSDHARAMQEAAGDTVLGDFTGARVGPPGNATAFFRDGRRFLVRTKGPDGGDRDFGVAYTFGVAPLQQYLIELTAGRYQALGVAWDARPRTAGGQRWFSLYPDVRPSRDPLHWTAPAHNWNHMCAECHSTDLRKNYSAKDNRYETTWAEVNVACEACHGPGSRHVAWARSGGAAAADPAKGLGVVFEGPGAWMPGAAAAIPRRVVAAAAPTEVETCARCHSRRTQLWPDYHAGTPLAHTHRVALLDEGVYFADGQIQDEVYEYGSFLQSRMHAAGVTCSNCHDPHGGTLRTEGNALCTRCHETARYEADAHHRHRAGSVASRCVACHMPERVYMAIDRRRDHSFRVPRPDESVRFGTPNACTACHADRPADWAAQAVERWFGSSAARRTSSTAALVAGRAGRPEAATLLEAVIEDRANPGIVRATAVALFLRASRPRSAGLVEASAADPDPLVRRAAAAALARLPAGARERVGQALLADPVRTVRLEAVLPMASPDVAAASGGLGTAFRAAADEFRRVQAFNADRAEARANVALLESGLGRVSEAIAAFRSAVALDPDFAPAYVGLADAQAAAGRESDAEATLAQGLARMPDAADLRHALGLALVRQGRRREALVALARAASLRPDEPRYAYVYGVALYDSGARDRALSALEQAASRHPGDRAILEALVAYAVEAHDLVRARAWAARLSAAAPDDPRVASLLAALDRREAR